MGEAGSQLVEWLPRPPGVLDQADFEPTPRLEETSITLMLIVGLVLTAGGQIQQLPIQWTLRSKLVTVKVGDRSPVIDGTGVESAIPGGAPLPIHPSADGAGIDNEPVSREFPKRPVGGSSRPRRRGPSLAIAFPLIPEVPRSRTLEMGWWICWRGPSVETTVAGGESRYVGGSGRGPAPPSSGPDTRIWRPPESVGPPRARGQQGHRPATDPRPVDQGVRKRPADLRRPPTAIHTRR